ncbi:MAG: ribosomal subunit interface protein [Gammaproteobacteria bacterium RIFCSPHIGHO2_12_FULL_45_9]|nr:MAG: ribosomal subunit interface protein [Gammaproteobacteria bacterium RIFCSPHIGHO2_12_FULL_45_9]
MQWQFDGKGITVTDALRELVQKKIEKLNHHAPNMQSVHVIFEVHNKVQQMAEANITLPGSVLHASAESDDMYKTVDLLVDKLNSQLAKYKDKHH